MDVNGSPTEEVIFWKVHLHDMGGIHRGLVVTMPGS